MILNQIVRNKSDYKTDVNSEKRLRSFVKSISWRVIGTLDTVLISWLITGTLSIAFAIGSVEMITKMVLYFFHERLWNVIKWGK